MSARGVKPAYLKRPSAAAHETRSVKRRLRLASLNTVCEEARCPNIAECFGRGTATFMILGDICTRGCRFCSVTTGRPSFDNFAGEADAVAKAAEDLQLQYVVLTSVARDDLPDGGAAAFHQAIQALRQRLPEIGIEVLIPDFRGNWDALECVLDAEPDVLNHNVETVPRLYRRVRPGASYRRSLELLQRAAKRTKAKTGVMLGLGEELSEVRDVMRDAKAHGVSRFTAGQYLQPTRSHLPVERYLEPEEFAGVAAYGKELGFDHIASGPLVRSSYRAEEAHRV